MQLIALGGPAGSGKSTLGEFLADDLDAPHIDFDDVTQEVLEAGRRQFSHLSEPELLQQLKGERYSALSAAVLTVGSALARSGGGEVVIVSAPFTRHSQSLSMWTEWLADCGQWESVVFVWLAVDPSVRLNRMQVRGSSRDAEVLAQGRVSSVPLPVIAHRIVDAGVPLREQSMVVSALLP